MRKLILALFFTLAYAVAAMSATVQLSWQANSESDIAGYKVYQGTTSGAYGEPEDVGNVTTYLMSLAPAVGQVFFFAVTAYDTSGNESAKSSEASVFVPDQTAPGAPRSVLIVVRVE